MIKINSIFLLCLIISFVFTKSVTAQFTNVMVDNSDYTEEPSIAINPLNPEELVAGANIENSYYSHDGGATWIKGYLNSSLGESGDPCLLSDSSGNFYYFHICFPNDKIGCQKSTDKGLNYSDGSFAWNNNSNYQDKEWAAIEPHTGNIYVTWSQYDNTGINDSSRIYFSKSTDGGVNFSQGKRINQIAGDLLYRDITDPHPFTGINEEIYVTFIDSVGIRFNKSLDYGDTWLAEQPVIDSVGALRYDSMPGVPRFRTQPYSACDRSNSSYRGNLYVSWADQRNGTTNSDIFFIKSSNGGDTWSLPLKVNTDSSNRQQYRNAMTVDPSNGNIYIVYYDRRNYTNDSTDVYLARSVNGGASWEDYKISSTGFINKSGAFDGDYIDIVACNGKVRPIWTRVDETYSSVWTCLFDEATLGVVSAEAKNNNFHFTVNPNPANIIAAVSFSDEVENSMGIVTDLEGRQVLSFSLKHEREKILDIHNLPSGVYFVKAGYETQKLIIQK